jgi:hypothetical protein
MIKLETDFSVETINSLLNQDFLVDETFETEANNQSLNNADKKVSLFCKGMWKGFKESIEGGNGFLSSLVGASGITVTVLFALGVVGTGGWAGVALLAIWLAYVIFNTISGGVEAIAPKKEENEFASHRATSGVELVKNFDRNQRHLERDDNNYGSWNSFLTPKQSAELQ